MREPVEASGGVQRRLGQLFALLAWALAIALALRFFFATKAIVLGLLGAGVLAATLKPLSDRFPGRRWFSAVLVGFLPIVVAGGVLFLVGWQIARVVQRELQRWPEMRQNINEMLSRWAQQLGFDQQVSIESVGQRLWQTLSGGAGSDAVSATAGWIAGLFLAFVLVLFGAMFLLGEPRARLQGAIAGFLPARRRPQLDAAIGELEPRLRWWLLGQAVSMAIVGLATWGGLALIGLPFAIPLGVLAGVAEIVPNIGPTVAFVVVLLVAATQGGTMVLKALLVWAAVQIFESYVLIPWVMKRAVHIPPLITLFSIVLWGAIFGLAGILLAIPLDLVLWSFATHFLARPEARAGPAGSPG